jgi:hypothetical protein
MMISVREIIISAMEMIAFMSGTMVGASKMIISETQIKVRRSEMIISERGIIDSGAQMIISMTEMVISVTNTMVKMDCRNNVSIGNYLPVVGDQCLCGTNDHFLDGNVHFGHEDHDRSDE